MIEKIFEIKQNVFFDFRKYACPDDELSYLFEDWVDYYRLKYAICKAIKPKNILEIGVRYGYSAIAFLNACKEASYLGIDNDSNTFGGCVGAINWAKNITKDYNADFLLANTQDMKSFQGDFYDLIHIDGQQDGDGTFHDLELALEQGRYILLDGCFWSTENMLSSIYFLKKYDRFVEYAMIIPGYAGELLIKTKEQARSLFCGCKERNYPMLSDRYDSHYFLHDCGGYSIFTKTNGLELDERLAAIYNLINPQPEDNILDLGCGRGELSFLLAQAGAKVTGIEYSNSALDIANKTYTSKYSVNNLKYVHGDVCEFNFSEKYNKIVASDLIEHIDAEPLAKMMDIISGSLKDDGVLIIHTPNLLSYRCSYRRKRKNAKRLGLWIPDNPRTYYEDLMNINEQTPFKLKRVLKRHFNYELTWVANLPDAAGSLSNDFSLSQICEARSIFAIASNKKIERNKVKALFNQFKLNTKELKVDILCGIKGLKLGKSQNYQLPVTIINKGKERLCSMDPHPVHISYHWVNKKGLFEIFDGERSPIRIVLQPNQQRDFQVNIMTPKKEGNYILQLTMVQEGCFWFEEILNKLPVDINVEIE